MIYPTTQEEMQAFIEAAMPAFLEYLRTHQTSIEQVELAQSSVGITSFPAIQNLGGVKKTVRVPLSLINGDSQAAAQQAAEAAARAEQEVEEMRDILDDIISLAIDGFAYAGLASPTTDPITGKVFYIATVPGTYTHFGNISVGFGLSILKYDDDSWVCDVVDSSTIKTKNDEFTTGAVIKILSESGTEFFPKTSESAVVDSSGLVLALKLDMFKSLINSNRASIMLNNNRTSNVTKSVDTGFYVTDSNGNVVLKYDSDGLDALSISDHFLNFVSQELDIDAAITLVGKMRSDVLKISSKTSEIGKSLDTGLFVTDAYGKVVTKYDGSGFDVYKLSSHFLSLIPNAKSSIKILAIGNSYTVDAYTFLPYICRALDVELTLYFTFLGGSGLDTNWNNLVNGTTLITYKYENGAWLSSNQKKKIIDLIPLYDWDYVVLQQVSTSCTDPTSIQPYLANFVNYINGVNPNIMIGWLNTPAYASANGYNDQQRRQMYDDMWAIIKSKVMGSGVLAVAAEGTAIENARTSATLKVLGARGMLNRDGLHLDFGIGRYVASLGVYMSLIYPYTNKSVLGCSFWPIWGTTVNVSWDTNSPARENQFTDVTQEQALIAQKCATAAYMRKDEVCDLSDF